MSIEYTDTATQGFRRAANQVIPITMSFLDEKGQRLLDDAQQLVPYDTGKLHDSGRLLRAQQVGNAIEVTVEFTASYAWKTHENPRAGRTRGVSPSGHKYKHFAFTGQWKYLESAALNVYNELRNDYLQYLDAHLG